MGSTSSDCGRTLGNYILAGAISGVVAGRSAARLYDLSLSGQMDRIGNIGRDMFNPMDMLTDAVIGGAFGAFTYGVIVFVTYIATINPEAKTVSIGSYPEYMNKARSEGYTSFNLDKYYNIFDALGLAKPMNELFMSNQINQAKDFVGTSLDRITPGYRTEIGLIQESGKYQQIGSGWTHLDNLFSSKVNWWFE